MNLGCGNKIYPDTETDQWINVDIVDPPAPNGNGTFVQSDLRDLSVFPDNYADHIFTSHVVEHIPVYDLDVTMKEWLRVLKPGGTIAFEMPDLVKCCINYLQLVTSGDPKMINRMGIYGFYGEQFPDAPYMIHRWGWTFKTLAPFLQELGLVDIKETTPVTHMGPVRDFRIEATKPL